MKFFTIFLYEWRHFVRTPFKLVAIFLFAGASTYALQNGASLFHKQTEELESIEAEMLTDRATYLAYYDSGEKGPKARPWVDLTTPYWAVWYTPVYHFKKPSPAMVYSIGQAEQYGFYKSVNFRSSTYDADMAEEIANPERLQSGTLDFSFVSLYLLPLLLLIFLYNVKGAEADEGFLSLIYTQTGTERTWLWARVSFYGGLVAVLLLVLMLLGAALTGVSPTAIPSFFSLYLWHLLYLGLWLFLFGLILWQGKSTIGNTLQMLGVWLLLAFIIPAAVHQWVSIRQPPSLMTDLIDAQRDDTYALYDEPDSVLQARVLALFPEMSNNLTDEAGQPKRIAANQAATALSNELIKASIGKIEGRNQSRNRLISYSYWFNPVSFMLNKLNQLSGTHYQDYQAYRDEIQQMIDKQIKVLVLDTWNGVEVNKQKYLEYQQSLN
ncbi:MAG: DUF3526 domain-containing protein [Bacteroidota bacterium]